MHGPGLLPQLLARNPSISTLKYLHRETLDRWKCALQFTLDLIEGFPLDSHEATLLRTLWHTLPLLLLRVNPQSPTLRQNQL
eukprot:1848143-Rhodomonas_salina.1